MRVIGVLPAKICQSKNVATGGAKKTHGACMIVLSTPRVRTAMSARRRAQSS
jgi:hypothetical protein